MPRRIRLVVLFGGVSAEHDISCVSARHVLAAADRDRYDIVAVGIGRDGIWTRAEAANAAIASGEFPAALDTAGTPVTPSQVLLAPADGPPGGSADSAPDSPADGPTSGPAGATVVFPLLHGPMGEDGTIQGLLETFDLPYVGTGVLGSALAMDKAKAKEVAAHHGIPQAAYRALRTADIDTDTAELLAGTLGLPAFVKPANMGSSVGVSRATDVDSLDEALETAARYDEWIVVEEAIVGREIEIGVLGNDPYRISVPGEIKPAGDFYDYADKYVDDAAELLVPALLDESTETTLRQLAADAARAMRVEGLARVDVFVSGERVLLNEVNTMPGFTPISMYPRMWAASGVAYTELVDELVRLALERFARRRAHRHLHR
ncbi:MAG: D-alanine--D-alanine ligase family protein [Acidimicrobiales bacterium]